MTSASRDGTPSDGVSALQRASAARSWRPTVWRVVKWTLFFAVGAFVARRGWGIWERDRSALADVRFDPLWFGLAGLAYACGWLPSVWFWRKVMLRLGGAVRYRDAARAYYCGHLGKYVPGKATVVVIRAALMQARGYRPAAAALAVMYETLVLMGSGAAMAAAWAPRLIPESRMETLPGWLRAVLERSWAPPVLVALACLAVLPVLARLFTVVAVKMTPAELKGSGAPVRIEARLLGEGLLAFAAGWALHGLSLGCTLRGVTGGEFDLAAWPAWTGATALATTGGFVVLLPPGGLGVREGLLFETLSFQPEIGPAAAVAGALVLRVIWFVTEIVLAGALSWGIRPPQNEAEPGGMSPTA